MRSHDVDWSEVYENTWPHGHGKTPKCIKDENKMSRCIETGAIDIKLLTETSKLPTKSNSADAGLDLYADTEEPVSIEPGETKLISTGIAMAIPRGYVGLVWDRSSLGVKGIHRFAGVIDSGYRGEVKVCLHNSNLPSRSTPEKNTYVVQKDDRIAQLIIQRVENFYVNQVKTLTETDRGEGGFGSSGK